MMVLSLYAYFLPFVIFLIFIGFFIKIFWLALVILIVVAYYTIHNNQNESHIRISQQFLEYHNKNLVIRTTWGNVKSFEAIPAHVNMSFHQPSGIGSYYEGFGQPNRPLRTEISLYLQDYSNPAELKRDLLAFYQRSRIKEDNDHAL
jgi:hypothetical protein